MINLITAAYNRLTSGGDTNPGLKVHCIHGFYPSLAVFLLMTSSMLQAQIFTDDGTPISPETPQLREKLRFRDTDSVEDTTWSHEFFYAPDPANELRLDVPVRHRNIQFTDASGVKHSDTLTGPGDPSLQWQHSLSQTDRVMESNRLAVHLRLEAPVGDDDETVDDIEIPRRLQLGQGDWSTTVGGVYARVDNRKRFSIQGEFTHNTRHDGMRMGKEADLNLAYWYRLHPVAFTSTAEQMEVRGVFELLSTYRFPSERTGSELDDAGLFLRAAPGLQLYFSPEFQLETALEVPVVEGIDDAVSDRDYALQVNAKFLF